MGSLILRSLAISFACIGCAFADNVVQSVGSGVATGVGTAVQAVGSGVGVVVPPAGTAISDSAITGEVKSKLAISTCSVCNISVTTNCGVVILKGTVKSQAQFDEAVNIAKSVCGVKSVDASNLVIK